MQNTVPTIPDPQVYTPWGIGYDDQQAGLPPTANPYPEGSDSAWEWNAGWDAAKRTDHLHKG